MFSPAIRLLLISSGRCDCFLATPGSLVQEASFGEGEVDAFATFVAARKNAIFRVMADQIEEDFRPETLPFLRGGMRAQLLARKAVQAYRDTPFNTAVAIGRETSGRRDEKVLLLALTNAQLLNLWLTPLSTHGIRISGIYSPPVVTPVLLKMIGGKAGISSGQVLIVSLNQAGLRQTFVDSGVARFSRLASVAAQPGMTSAELATACMAEIVKTQQYLVNLRLVQRDSALEALVITPPGATDAWQNADARSESLQCHFLASDRANAEAGLKRVVPLADHADAIAFHADVLWLHAIASRRPAIDFAPAWVSEAFRVWRARVAIWSTSAVLGIAGCMAGAYWLTEATFLQREAAQYARQTAASEALAQRVRQGFPPIPTTPDNLKASVTAIDALQRRVVSPRSLISDIGQSLSGADGFTLTGLDWLVAINPDDGIVETGTAPAQPAPGTAANNPDRYEIVILTGSIVTPEPAASPRMTRETGNRTIEALGRIGNAQVRVIKLPVDLSPNATLSGGTGQAEATAGQAQLVVRVVRKMAP